MLAFFSEADIRGIRVVHNRQRFTTHSWAMGETVRQQGFLMRAMVSRFGRSADVEINCPLDDLTGQLVECCSRTDLRAAPAFLNVRFKLVDPFSDLP